jgi:hypothetical protein
MKRIILICTLLIFGITLSAQGPFSGFFKPTVDKKLLIQKESILAAKAITAPVVLFRPVVNVNFIEVTKSTVEGETLTTKSLSRGGMGLSLAFFKGAENTFSINVLALTPLNYSDGTKFNVSPAIAIEGLKILSVGVGRDTEVHKWFGMLGVSYNFTAVK